MRVLVTGGAGYIGSVTSASLINEGHEVVVFDNLSQGHRAAVHPKALLVEGHLANSIILANTFKSFRPEAIMHFASHTLVGESMQNPFLYIGDNVTNGLSLLRVAMDFGVRRFILSSTANLFDDPARIPIDESAAIIPGSPYGESKYILERFLFWLEKTHGLQYACLRYFNAAGATAERGEDHDPEMHLIPIVLQVAQGKREQVTVFGNDYGTPDGTCIRDYIHVSDLARAHMLALEAIDSGSRTYNLGSGKGFSVREVVETARKITGHPIPVKMGTCRPGDPPRLVADSGKIRRELGWKPAFPDLHGIIESAWRWHQKFPNGYPD